MTDSVVVEGYARLREGKKWKTRWIVLRKPSPVADCLVLLVFKDKSEKAQGTKERARVTLEEICGLEAGQWYEGVAFTLFILCLNQAALLGFDSRDGLQVWEARLRYSLGEVHRFAVGVLPGTKLEAGPAALHLCNNLLALARDVPPTIIGHWNLPDLRRYGPVPHGFVFEGGTRCGYWAGVFLLASAESEQISFLFDCIVRGISPTRGPFGLRPVLPDLSASQTHYEEKLNHEAQELEKRLSMLSHGSSTVSSTYSPCAGGDDRSISGSSDTSDTSQSDCSIGSRITIWAEPASNPDVVSHVGAKAELPIGEKLSAGQGAGNRPVAKAARQLKEIGRQSSSDSGIATGSHSSYSGSFSSYTGSLENHSGEDFGSIFSLPPHLLQELSPCSCPSGAGHEYQVPTSLRYLYDTPRSVRQETSESGKENEPSSSIKDSWAPLGLTVESTKGNKTNEGHAEAPEKQSLSDHVQIPSEESKKSSGDPSLTNAPKTIVTICSVCGGFKGTSLKTSISSMVPVVPDPSDRDKASSTFTTETFQEETPPVTRTGSSLLQRAGREKLSRLLTDLLSGHAQNKSPTPYEPMSPALGSGVHATPAGHSGTLQQRSRTVVYEKCVKCRREQCRPPPRVIPRKTVLNTNASTSQTAAFRFDQQHESSSNEELTGEDKKLHSKEERCKADTAYEVMESRMLEKSSEMEGKKYELMGSYSQRRLLSETEGTPFAFPPENQFPERARIEGVTYVNIPVSPTSKKQLNYMELELQDPGLCSRGPATHLPAHRMSSTKYAQIDITATETAHKVGTQHALGRQEGLHALELRRKATPH